MLVSHKIGWMLLSLPTQVFMQIDNFLPETSIKNLRQQALSADYQDWEGPDHIVYKHISVVDITEIHDRLTEIYGRIDVLGMAWMGRASCRERECKYV